MKQHPLSAAFPAMAADEYEALKDSISVIGVQNPITLFEGMVLDGWHRWTAANEVGMNCPSVDLGDVDPRDFVLAQNKNRRHVSQAQIALAAAAVFAWRPVGANQHGASALSAPPQSLESAAERVGVSRRTMAQAKAVESAGAPEVQEAVKRGEIGLPKAAKIAQLPKEEQAAAITKPAPKKAKPEPEEDYGPDEAEIAALEAAAAADMLAMEKLFDADDKLAEAFKEIKRLNAEVAQLKLSRDGYMNKSNELISTIKSLQRKLDKLQKVAA